MTKGGFNVRKYDVLVIGGGPGGYVAAIRGAQLGLSVGLVEDHKIGGTCLNYGCIPTKALYRQSEVMDLLSEAKQFGIQIEGFRVDLDVIRARKNAVVDELVGGIVQLLAANGVEVIDGFATFEDQKTLRVKDELYGADHVVIATGSRPALPPIPGLDLPGVMTSREALELHGIPERLAVIGGGVIGMEMAEIYRALGSSVTVYEGEKQILSQIDKDLTKRLQLSLKRKGLTLETGTLVRKIEQEGDLCMLHTEKKNKECVTSFNAVLVATGRRPNTEGLGLERLEVAMDQGAIVVNDAFETSVPGLYAVGDVNGRCLLAHAASHQGIDVMERIAGHAPAINHALFPNCIFIDPEIATCGLSEDQAKAAGIAVKVSKVPFAANGKALALGKTEGLVKIIASEEEVILGCQIMGQGASVMIHEAMVAIDRKMTAKEIHQIIHAHPTLSETFMEAVAAIGGEAIHQVPKKKKGRS